GAGAGAAQTRQLAQPDARDRGINHLVSVAGSERGLRRPRVPLPDDPSPVELLQPRHAVAPFRGREPELAELEGWCAGGGRLEVALVTGPAGSGKTRLAVELCAARESDGWT